MAYKNKEDQVKCAKKHYEANKELYKNRARVWTSSNIKECYLLVSRYKLDKGCTDCGFSGHPQALEFDHIGGNKLGDISTLIRRGWSIKRVMTEIEKCEVVCANCHRIRTYNRRIQKEIG